MTDTVKLDNKGKTLVIAHRGGSIQCENTVNAFEFAGHRSYFGIETDVHVTKDGKYVIYHDDSTGRLCDRDIVVEDSTFDELRALKVRGEHVIPTLDEYLTAVAAHGKTAVVELKNKMTDEHIKNIVTACLDKLSPDKLIFISFCFENLVSVRKILPNQTVQYLPSENSPDLLPKLVAHKFDIDAEYHALTAELVKALHSFGIKVNCWTCDDSADARRLIEWGVDYITTNVLE